MCDYDDMTKKKHIKRSAKRVRESSTGWMLNVVSSNSRCEMNKELDCLGLKIDQFAILMTLLEKDGLTQTEIGKKVLMPAYATTRSLDVLEEKGLVKREEDERSRRSYRINLTKKGRDTKIELFEVVDRVNATLLAPLTEEENVQFNQLLNKLLVSALEGKK